MTHDELLAKVNKEDDSIALFVGARTEFGDALRSIIKLHKPYINYRNQECFCTHCGESIDYPCPTIQAIEKELG